MNAAIKSNQILNSSFSAIFGTSVELVSTTEPENSDLENFEFFRSEITNALTTGGFYQLVYPTSRVNCLDQQDIFDATFDGKNIEAMHYQLMTTKNEFDVIQLRRAVRTLAIEALANTWATEEAANVGSQ